MFINLHKLIVDICVGTEALQKLAKEQDIKAVVSWTG